MALGRVVRNSTFMLVAQAITWLSSMALIATLGRTLGDDGFGDLYLAIAFGTIAYVLVEFGVGPQLEREVARDPESAGRHLANALVIKVAFSLVAFGLISVVVRWLHYPESLQRTIMVYSISLPFMAVSTSLTSIYRAVESVFHATVGQVIEKVSICLLTMVLLKLHFGVVAVAGAYVAGSVASAIWQACFLIPRLRGTLAVDRRVVRSLLRGGLPFFMQGAAAAIYARADILLLSVLADAAVKGWYGAAYRLFETLYFLSGIMSAVLYPILARLSVGPRAEFRRAIGTHLNAMLILGAPVCVGLFVLAGPIVLLVFGQEDFLPAVPALRWLAIALFLGYVEAVARGVIIGINRERRMVPAAFLGAALNVGLNWLLIPHFQHVGAAAVTAATELLIVCYWFMLVPKDLLPRDALVVALKVALASGSMAGALYLLRGLPLPLLILAGGVVYCAGTVLFQTVPREDLRAVGRIVSDRRRRAGGVEATRI